MSNMYDILGKLNGLTPKQEEAQPAKPLNESVEARGSIIAGVKDIEQKLREQYEASKKFEEGSHYGNEKLANARASRTGTSTVRDQDGKGGVKTTTTKTPAKKADEVTKEERETLKTKSGTIYKGGTYGNADYDSEGKPAKKGPIVRRKNADGTGKKGRPSKAEKAEKGEGEKSYNAPKGDIFGRTTGTVPKGNKGTVVKGKGNIDTVDEGSSNPFAIGMAQAKKEVGLGRAKATGLPKKVVAKGHEIGKAVQKGMNESRDHETSEYTYETIGRRLANENPHMDTNSDLFFDAVYDEMIEIGMSPRAARNKLNYDEDFLGDTASAYAHFAKTTESRGPSFAPQHPGVPAPVAKPSFLDKAKDFGKKAVGATLNTLGHGSDEQLKDKLRQDMMGEQNELNELAKLAGLQVEEGKKAKPDYIDADNDGDEKESMEKALDDKEKVDECMSPIAGGAEMMQQAEQQKGRMSVNTSADSEGHKTVTITADGEEAEKLAQLLKLAGMGSQQPQPAQQAAIVVAQEAKAYGDTEVEEPEEVANTPRPEVRGMDRAETTGTANTSDDLHKQKSQHPDAAAKGDNPLTKKETATEAVNPIEALGAKLMAEYQSIKLQK